MNINYQLIGDRIKKRRKELGYTQEHLAEKLLVSSGYISQIERGITRINLDTLGQIANLLECDIADFLSSSNFANKNYMEQDINLLYQRLNATERSMLYKLLTTYLKNK